jgi:hypothetical protein
MGKPRQIGQVEESCILTSACAGERSRSAAAAALSDKELRKTNIAADVG